MIHPKVYLALLAAASTVLAATVPTTAHADRWEVRREVRKGYYEVERAKRRAERDVRRCTTRECAEREIRRGYRDVEREKREARGNIRRELRQDYYRDSYYRGGDRWYRDGRYWNRNDYERRYYRKRDRDGNEFLKGVVVGAAVVGVAAAIAQSNDD